MDNSSHYININYATVHMPKKSMELDNKQA